jgi:hypothetical protein
MLGAKARRLVLCSGHGRGLDGILVDDLRHTGPTGTLDATGAGSREVRTMPNRLRSGPGPRSLPVTVSRPPRER